MFISLKTANTSSIQIITALIPATSDIKYTAESCFLASAVCPLIEEFNPSISFSIASAYEATSVLASWQAYCVLWLALAQTSNTSECLKEE